MAWTVESFQTPTGHIPVVAFVDGLSTEDQQTAIALIKILREYGNELRGSRSKALGGGLFELRDVPSGIRIFYTFKPGHRIVLLDGMVKKRDAIPPSVMAQLRQKQKEVR